jgi:hypothetical protein
MLIRTLCTIPIINNNTSKIVVCASVYELVAAFYHSKSSELRNFGFVSFEVTHLSFCIIFFGEKAKFSGGPKSSIMLYFRFSSS